MMLASAAVVAVAGCGTADERGAAASATALRMLSAVESKDGSGACAVLAPKTASALEQSAGSSCPAAILDEDLPKPGAVTGTQVYGQWAQVRLSTDTVFLGLFPGGWRVVAAGCRPEADKPYDCTLQGG